MILYHGTTASCARKILKEGIVPQSISDKSRWEKRSIPSLVYLTNAYGVYFANAAACCETGDDRASLLVIDSDALDDARLLPDEDSVDIEDLISADFDNNEIEDFNSQRNRLAALKKLAEHGHDYEVSLAHIGNCAYEGVIPASAIKSIITWDSQGPMLFACDASIGRVNFMFCGDRHRLFLDSLAQEKRADECYGTAVIETEFHPLGLEEYVKFIEFEHNPSFKAS